MKNSLQCQWRGLRRTSVCRLHIYSRILWEKRKWGSIYWNAPWNFDGTPHEDPLLFYTKNPSPIALKKFFDLNGGLLKEYLWSRVKRDCQAAFLAWKNGGSARRGGRVARIGRCLFPAHGELDFFLFFPLDVRLWGLLFSCGFIRQDDVVCLSCTQSTGTGISERVCLAAEGFGNRYCFLETVSDKVSKPPEQNDHFQAGMTFFL